MTSPPSPGSPLRVLVPLADGVEEIEAVICIDLFRRAGWTVCAASLGGDSVRASRGVGLLGDDRLENVLHEAWDLICIPGGAPGVEAFLAYPELSQRVQQQHVEGFTVAAVCAGPRVLEQAGLLGDIPFTCHPGVVDHFPGRTVSSDPVVVAGRVITSRGPGTAMLFALTLIERLEGKAAAEAVAGPLCQP